MKALVEIIDYLRDRGLLTREQLVSFAEHGILPWHKVYAEAAADEGATAAAEPPATDDGYADVGGEPRRRGGAGRPPALTAAQLCERLAEASAAWRPALDGLTRVGRRLRTCDGWPAAAAAVRSTSAGALIDAVAGELDDPAGGLARLWQAAVLEDYRGVLRPEDRYGPTVNAYLALLRCDERGSLGPHAWLLGEAAAAAVFNLKLAQRRLLRAWGVVFYERPDLIAAALRRADLDDAYWAFVLLYTARRGRGATGDRPPLRPAPPDDDWPRVWARAVALDPSAATTFLIDREEALDYRPLALVHVLASVLQAYPAEDRTALQRFYRDAESPPEIAARLRRPPADVNAALDRFRRDVAGRLARHPSLVVFLRSELARGWEAFLGHFLREFWRRDGELSEDDLPAGRRPAAAALLAEHFGPAYDLLCPKTWD